MQEGEFPFAILSSPLARALETAEIVAEVTHLAAAGAGETRRPSSPGRPASVEIRRELGMGTEKLALLAELVRGGRKRVMIVGHEPDLSMLVASLDRESPPGGMQKAMVVGVKLIVDPRVAGLEFRSIAPLRARAEVAGLAARLTSAA